jgi:Flp pilus assembly protein TadG
MSRVLAGLRNTRHGSVAIWVALISPMLTAGVAMGVDVGSWAATKLTLQRTADTAAIAGAIAYNATSDKRVAAAAAASLAQLNGITASGDASWNSGSSTFSQGNITASVRAGIYSPADTAVNVTVKKSVPLLFGQLIYASSATTVSANGTAEIIVTTTTTGGNGGQPCVLGLAGSTTGVTTNNDITTGGNSTISMAGCTIRSDGGILVGNNTTVVADAFYAGGTISGPTVGTLYPNSGQLLDPYSNATALQTALTATNNATPSSGISCTGSGCTGGSASCDSNGCTVQPGTYSGLSVNGSKPVTLAPGLYKINGNISIKSSSVVTGSGVTILMGAGPSNNPYSLAIGGGSTFNITAATTAGATGGAIAGVALASLTSNSTTFNGSSSLPWTGLIYFPNGKLDLTGTVTNGAASSSGCAQAIGSYVILGGNTTLAIAGCTPYGTKTYASLPTIVNTTAVPTLVQ